MKKYNYKIKFVNGDIIYKSAFNMAQAEILAKAEQIKKGLDYNVESVILIG